MSRSNALWLILLIVAGGFLAFSLVQAPTPQPVPVASQSTEPVDVPATATIAPTATAVAAGGTSAEICTTPQPIPGGIFAEGIIGAPRYPNPIHADNNPVDQQLVDLIYDGLVSFDRSGIAQPALADSWTVSDDGLTVTFQLRDDALWHDGQPFSSADVAFTYQLLQADSMPDSTLWQSVAIATPDPLTVEFTLEAPYAPFLVAVNRGILPAHLLSGISAEAQKTDPFNAKPVGTGPFAVTNDWTADGVLRLRPHDAYWRQTIGLDELNVRFFANESARATAFANGAISGLIDVASPDIVTALGLPGARLFSAEQPRYAQLAFNLSDSGHPAIQDETVRRAFALGTDKAALVQQALNGQAIPFSGPYVPSAWAASPTYPLGQTSVTSATQLLSDAGWVAPEGGGLRLRATDDVTETLSLRVLTANSAETSAVTALLEQQWAALGASITVESVPLDQFRDRLASRAFDIALLTVTPLADPDLYDFWSQDALMRGQNFGAWNNQRASEALEAARQLWTIEERGPLYGAFNREFAADTPAISLYQYVQSYVIADGVISAETNRPITMPPLSRPRDRFNTLPVWRVLTESVEVACE